MHFSHRFMYFLVLHCLKMAPRSARQAVQCRLVRPVQGLVESGLDELRSGRVSAVARSSVSGSQQDLWDTWCLSRHVRETRPRVGGWQKMPRPEARRILCRPFTELWARHSLACAWGRRSTMQMWRSACLSMLSTLGMWIGSIREKTRFKWSHRTESCCQYNCYMCSKSFLFMFLKAKIKYILSDKYTVNISLPFQKYCSSHLLWHAIICLLRVLVLCIQSVLLSLLQSQHELSSARFQKWTRLLWGVLFLT